ncbi:MAG: D-alanyl-D-alanine carboxypeptidase, partial [Actinomycetota bacterium]
MSLLLTLGAACTAGVDPPTEPRRVAPPAAPQRSPGVRADAPAAPERRSSCRRDRNRDVHASRADVAWKKAIGRVVDGFAVGVAVGSGGRIVYSHDGGRPRVPASNQKLLLSMALFDRFGPHHRSRTRASATKVRGGTVEGHLWIVGRGDPTVTRAQPGYWGDLRATTLSALARRIKRARVDRIDGRVMGATGYFAHDLDAPGWQPYVPDQYVQLPSSLVLNGNYAG